jgi:anaerobic sulfite reductase subunit C
VDWDREAEELLTRAPRFVRPLVRRKVEEFARREGADRVSGALAQRAYAAVRGKQPGDGRKPTQELIAQLETEAEQVAASDAFRTPHYQVHPCAGAVGCPRSLIPVREMAEQLTQELADSGFSEFLEQGLAGRPLLSHHRFQVAVAGCPNACSQPQIRDFGVIGRTRVEVDASHCTGCLKCVKACHEDAITVTDRVPVVDHARCLGCGDCVRVCPSEALRFGEPAYETVVGGKLGRHPRLANRMGLLSDLGEVTGAQHRVLDALLRHGRPGERVGTLLEREGKL